jgi:D-glycero-alpha-D-manno-heptose-7-phosphate kinase
LAAQEKWPSHTITMVVPFPPGGVADTVARPVAEAMSRQLGQPIIIENKAGAGGGVGMASVSKAKPDGYTILMTLSSISIIPEADKILGKDMSYQINQFKPIARFTADPTVLVVRADSPWNTYEQFLAEMKKNSGKYNFGSSGNYGTMHIPMEMIKLNDGFEMIHHGDLPSGTGMGSSSTFTVGMLHSLYSLTNYMPTKRELALKALNVEQQAIGESVGSQDQVAAAFGGFNRITFHQDDTFDVEPLMISQERKNLLNSHLMLFFTGFSRIADSIAKSKIENFLIRQKEMNNISKMVERGMDMLTSNQSPISDFGLLLDEAWSNKRALSNQVSNPQIDAIYDNAKMAGALGGKLLGAGGGGFMLLFVQPKNQNKVKEVLSDLVHVPFGFDNSGSRVVLYQPDGF